MGAMEGADAKMDDADAKLIGRKDGLPHHAGQRGEGLQG
jgi:hypothetical protein